MWASYDKNTGIQGTSFNRIQSNRDDLLFIDEADVPSRPHKAVIENNNIVDFEILYDKEIEDLENEVRSIRDTLLTNSDWTQVPDAPVDQQAWANYRQALRDVPQQAGFPTDINWPSKPE